MKQLIKTETITVTKHTLFLFSYFIYIIAELLDSSYLGEILSANIRRGMKSTVILILLVALFARKEYKKSTLLKYLAICVIAIFVSIFSKEPNVLVIVLLLLTCYDTNVETIINLSLFTMFSSFVFIIGLSFLGVLPDLLYSHYSLATNSIVQAHSYGFKYYSTPGCIVSFISFAFLYKYRTLKVMLICLLANAVSYYIFTAKLPFFCYLLFLFLNIVFRLNDKKIIRSFNQRVLPMLPFMLALLIYLLSKNFYNLDEVGQMINFILSGRLEQGSIGLKTNGITLFGSFFNTVGRYSSTYSGIKSSSNSFYIDSDYLYMMLHFGIIYSFFIFSCYSVAIKKFVVENDIYMLSWIVTVTLYALSNWCLHNIEYNPLLFIGFTARFKDVKNTENINLKGKGKKLYEFQNYFS